MTKHITFLWRRKYIRGN